LLRPILHIVMHFAVPAIVAGAFFRKKWLTAWLVMLAGLAIDLDHLLANPVFDPNRCSLGFHPLHSWVAAVVYAGLAIWPAGRILGIGLLLHLGLDGVDCLLISW